MDWLSPQQLTGLPGMPTTVQGVRYKARTEVYRTRNNPDGRGTQIHISSLPEETQAHLAAEAVNSAAAETPEFAAGKAIAERMAKRKELSAEMQQQLLEDGAAQLMKLSGKARLRAECKLTILGNWHEYLQPWILQRKKTEGEHAFADDYNGRVLELSDEVYRTIERISWNNARRWQKVLEEQGAAALAGRYTPAQKSVIEEQPEMQELCLGMLHHQPDIKATNLQKVIRSQGELKGKDWKVPSVSAVQRWLTSFEKANPLLMHQLRDPDGFKNRRQVAWGKADEGITRINQLWELDSTPSDVLLTDGRYMIIGGIDVHSRRPFVVVHPTSSAEGVCLLLRRGILNLGLPEGVKTDNGKDYVSKRVVSVLSSLAIRHERTKPFSGDEKPHIERFFKTWAHGISKLLPGYGGHNVAERQKIRARRSFADRILKKGQQDIEVSMSSRELQAAIDDWIEHEYMHEKHNSLGCTPFQKWHAKRATIRTLSNERALDLLLSPVPASGGAPAGVRSVTKGAGIGVLGFDYMAPELGPWIGEKVFCSWDPADIARLYVFEPNEMAFIGVAICPQLAGHELSLAELSKAAKAQQKAATADQKEVMRKAGRKVQIEDVARDVVEASKRRNGSLIGLPHREEAADTVGIQGAHQAANYQRETPTISKADFERRRAEQLAVDQAVEAARNAKPRFRTQFEEFMWLLQQSRIRSLTADEQRREKAFRQTNPDWAKRGEKLVFGEAKEEKASR